MDVLELIRSSTDVVCQQSKHVKINDANLTKECHEFVTQHKIKAHKEIWADNDFHFCDVDRTQPAGHPTYQSELTAKFIIVLDCLNHCFWPDESLEYHHLGNGLKRTLLADSKAFDADRLITVTPEILKQWFDRELPNAEERCRLLQEVGHALIEHFNGSIRELILSAKNSASKLVDIVTRYFWGFRDSTVYKGRQVFLYKRAQIFVGDLWGAYEGKGLGHFNDIERLTMFADYRVPQILREMGILEYSEELSKLVDNKQEIPVGSEMEVEIRAVTVQAVEKMRDVFNANQCNLLALEIDWMLWGRGEAMLDRLPPHHRTFTIFY
ncbi:UPF0553 family protein [Heterostelium album PN500]|uniref:Queuosine 5'-phosphate N-glycosylase/hydrolase n=1 Tax=Heterostelium pallidum (strain ATCC 26659 / Pp 5 / PN500) TaxID=670386 RepID=D3BGB8_HETP5|nr:UPF0553 family protein [Heterostelium album PN500]EFA79518.1 UPF0553 family protein [Heterostelium album PN500]|eukprot:XP_020431639.1 UPF0553 family protein [Heterostelium album PN500]